MYYSATRNGVPCNRVAAQSLSPGTIGEMCFPDMGTDSSITPEGALRLETDGGPVDIYAGNLAMATGN